MYSVSTEWWVEQGQCLVPPPPPLPPPPPPVITSEINKIQTTEDYQLCLAVTPVEISIPPSE